MLALMSAGQQAFMGIPNLDEVEALELLEDDKRNLALRAIRNDETSLLSLGGGLKAKNPSGRWTVYEHILYGSSNSSWEMDPWISTTRSPLVAATFEAERKSGIVVVDLDKLKNTGVREVWIEEPWSKAALAYGFQQEVSIRGHVPMDAIIGYVPHMG